MANLDTLIEISRARFHEHYSYPPGPDWGDVPSEAYLAHCARAKELSERWETEEATATPAQITAVKADLEAVRAEKSLQRAQADEEARHAKALAEIAQHQARAAEFRTSADFLLDTARKAT